MAYDNGKTDQLLRLASVGSQGDEVNDGLIIDICVLKMKRRSEVNRGPVVGVVIESQIQSEKMMRRMKSVVKRPKGSRANPKA